MFQILLSFLSLSCDYYTLGRVYMRVYLCFHSFYDSVLLHQITLELVFTSSWALYSTILFYSGFILHSFVISWLTIIMSPSLLSVILLLPLTWGTTVRLGLSVVKPNFCCNVGGSCRLVHRCSILVSLCIYSEQRVSQFSVTHCFSRSCFYKLSNETFHVFILGKPTLYHLRLVHLL